MLCSVTPCGHRFWVISVGREREGEGETDKQIHSGRDRHKQTDNGRDRHK